MPLSTLIEIAKTNNVVMPNAVFCGRHPLAVRRQMVIDALRASKVVF